MLAGAATLGALTQGALFFATQAIFPNLLNTGVPRSIPLIDMLLTRVVIAAPRFSLLLWSPSARRYGKAHAAPQARQHALIAGAGEAGTMMLRELRANPQTGLLPVGFVDDDPSQTRHVDPACAVLGDADDPGAGARAPGGAGHHRHAHSARHGHSRDRGHLRGGRRRARIIPGIYELLSGAVSINQLRERSDRRPAAPRAGANGYGAGDRADPWPARAGDRRRRLHRHRAVPPNCRCGPAS